MSDGKLVKIVREGKRDLFLAQEEIDNASIMSQGMMVDAHDTIESLGPVGLFDDGDSFGDVISLMRFRAAILTATLLYSQALNALIRREPDQVSLDMVELCHRELGDRFHEISAARAEQRGQRNDG